MCKILTNAMTNAMEKDVQDLDQCNGKNDKTFVKDMKDVNKLSNGPYLKCAKSIAFR